MAVSVVDPDAILVREHLGGERDAFDVLYRRYFPRLVRLCTRLTKDGAAAEDIAQETLVRAHDHLERFDQTRPMWPWLKTMATRLFIDQTRGKARELPMEGRPDDGRHDEHGWNEEREVLAQALAKLSPRQRTAVALRYIEDWDGPEVAEFFGLSGLAVRQMLHRATRKLQTEYRKIAEPVMGAILVPVGWLRRMSNEVAARLRPTMTRPEAVKALVAVTALNLVVATTAVLGGEGRDAPPSVVRSAPPSSDIEGVSHASGSGTKRSSKDIPSVDGPSGVAVPASQPFQANDSASITDKAGQRGEDVVTGVTDPNGEVSQPEDAKLFPLSYSPRFATDRTAYVAGTATCSVPHCPPVLFRTIDGGASWERLEGAGFNGRQILLPPAYGAGDQRIFAVGPLGLEVSEDGGSTFRPAAATTVADSAGSSAISPGFNNGDPTIVMGDQSLIQYRDDLKTAAPTRPVPGRGPLHPAFSPNYQEDGLLFVGGLEFSGVRWAPSVFRCSGEVCSGAPLSVETSETPRVRPSPDFAVTGLAYAFTTDGLFASMDRGEAFREVAVPWVEPLRDVASSGGGRLFAAVRSPGPDSVGFVYESSDGGGSWSLLENPAFAGGVTSIRVSGDHVLAALHGGGIACSADAGETWAARCPAS